MMTNNLFLDTCVRLLQERRPNLFRLYLNPFVAQTCLCLNKFVQEMWYIEKPIKPAYQSFLANGFDEALSGAIKLARYSASGQGRSLAGLAIDCDDRLGPFVSIAIAERERLVFLPDLTVVGVQDIEAKLVSASEGRFGYVVVVLSSILQTDKILDSLLSIQQRGALLIACLDRDNLSRYRKLASSFWQMLLPDIVIFDESFVHKDVPFGAFTARKRLYDYWNTPGNSTFHSTTFQPNSISSLHFMRCLEKDDPEFYLSHKDQLERILSDRGLCRSLLRDLYSPFLIKTITALGTDSLDTIAQGHYVHVKERRIFDGVAGVACSVRGHNPPNYVQEITALNECGDYHQAVADRLNKLTSLPKFLPAVSGASAVENALRIGLTAQYPRKYVLALQGGFGGKTLLALTGTANPSYKKHLGPLYESVVYQYSAGSLIDKLAIGRESDD